MTQIEALHPSPPRDLTLSPAAFFRWCMATVDAELIPIKRAYPKYSSLQGSDQYLWEQYDQRVIPIGVAARSGQRVLEIGCGLGIELHWLALQGVEVVGIEVDSYSVRCARHLTEHLATAFGRPLAVDIRRVSILDLPSTETFDFIYTPFTSQPENPLG